MDDVSDLVESLRERLAVHVDAGEQVKAELADLFAAVAEEVFGQQGRELEALREGFEKQVGGIRQMIALLERQEDLIATDREIRAENLSQQSQERKTLANEFHEHITTSLETTRRSTMGIFQNELGGLSRDVATFSEEILEQHRRELETLGEGFEKQVGGVRRMTAMLERQEESIAADREVRAGEIQLILKASEHIRTDLEIVTSKIDRLGPIINQGLKLTESLSQKILGMQREIDTGLKYLEERQAEGFRASQERLWTFQTSAEEQSLASFKDTLNSIHKVEVKVTEIDDWYRQAVQALEKKFLIGLGIVGSLMILTTILTSVLGS